jgi:predicted RNA methylase
LEAGGSAALGLQDDETVFDLGAGSGYFSFTEKPDLLPYQVLLVFGKGT